MERHTRVVIRKFGADLNDGIARLEVERFTVDPSRRPKSGHVVLATVACGINYPDLLMLAGKYQRSPPLPYCPGMECCGVVVAIGPDVDSWLKVGDRVVASCGTGGLATHVVVRASECSPAPFEYSNVEAAAASIASATAYHCLVERAQLRRGEVVLVIGATGGVGLATVQLAKTMGCFVVAVGGALRKLATVTAHGADAVVSYDTTPEFWHAVKAATPGRSGVDVVVDTVGGNALLQGVRCCKPWEGRVCVAGFTSGVQAAVPSNQVLIKGVTLLGCRAGEALRRNPSLAEPRARALAELAMAGKIRPHVSHVFGLHDTALAFQALLNREVVGRVVITIDGPTVHSATL